MSTLTRIPRLLYPWRVAAVAIAALMLTLSLVGRAEAVDIVFTLNDNTVSVQTAGQLDITLDGPLNDQETIVVTFPVGWTVQGGALTGFDLQNFALPPTVTGNAGTRTVTFTIDGFQPDPGAPISIPISATAELVNPGAPAVGLEVLVDATGQAQGTSAPFNIVAPAATAAITGTI